jgi:hypothetical protein
MGSLSILGPPFPAGPLRVILLPPPPVERIARVRRHLHGVIDDAPDSRKTTSKRCAPRKVPPAAPGARRIDGRNPIAWDRAHPIDAVALEYSDILRPDMIHPRTRAVAAAVQVHGRRARSDSLRVSRA